MMGGGYNAQSLGVNLTNGEVGTSDQAVAITKLIERSEFTLIK